MALHFSRNSPTQAPLSLVPGILQLAINAKIDPFLANNITTDINTTTQYYSNQND
jgi:hypothetical protein